MPKLSIPYRSQWDADAKQNNSDCGPTCLAMILNHFGVAMTPDGVYAHLPPKEPSDFTFFGELADVARAHGLTPQYHNFGNRDADFAGMRSLIDANQPPRRATITNGGILWW